MGLGLHNQWSKPAYESKSNNRHMGKEFTGPDLRAIPDTIHL